MDRAQQAALYKEAREAITLYAENAPAVVDAMNASALFPKVRRYVVRAYGVRDGLADSGRPSWINRDDDTEQKLGTLYYKTEAGARRRAKAWLSGEMSGRHYGLSYRCVRVTIHVQYKDAQIAEEKR